MSDLITVSYVKNVDDEGGEPKRLEARYGISREDFEQATSPGAILTEATRMLLRSVDLEAGRCAGAVQ